MLPWPRRDQSLAIAAGSGQTYENFCPIVGPPRGPGRKAEATGYNPLTTAYKKLLVNGISHRDCNEQGQANMIEENPSIAAAPASLRSRRDILCPAERANAQSDDWARIGLGIVFAGGAYPIVLSAVFSVSAAVAALWNMLIQKDFAALAELFSTVFAVILFSIFGAYVGALWSGFVAVLTLPVVYLVVWSLDLRTSIVRIGAFAGGLVGFICVLPIMLGIPWLDPNGDVWGFIVMLLVGPLLTTLLGQLGGAWGGSKSRDAAGASDYLQRLIGAVPAGTPIGCSTVDGPRPRFQFRIRHLLWVSVWLSLLLALIRVSGFPFELLLPVLVGWLLFQMALLWAGGFLLRWLIRWRERRQMYRST